MWGIKSWFKRCDGCCEIIWPWQKIALYTDMWGHYHQECWYNKWENIEIERRESEWKNKEHLARQKDT